MLEPEAEEAALHLLERAFERADPAGYIASQTNVSEPVRKRAAALYDQSLQTDGPSLTQEGLRAAERLEDWKGRELGGYRITELIGRGGMGSVFAAARIGGDFDHRAAIKIGHGNAPNEAQLERLRAERQLLGKLVHPNIAQLYGGGELQNGAPFIIMELVEGRPLHEAIEGMPADLGARLNIVLQVCAGLQYAHQSSVVHLDISPRNVLVMNDGFVKIIDFGVGVLVGMSDGGNRHHRTAGFTDPALENGVSSTLSDIYSVGRLLEFVLRDCTIVRRRDLKAIIEKATADRLDDRYPSIDALASDIRRYRDGYSVDARGRHFGLSALRFAQRHKLASAASIFGVIALFIGGLTISTLYLRSVESERRAETRFEEVRSLANFLLFDLYDKLNEVPGTVEAREEIARLGGSYLDRLSAIEGAGRSLRLETANGYRRLGDITGNPITGNLGKREVAEPLLKKAYEELKKLENETPDEPDVLRALGQTAYSLAVFSFIAEDDNAAALGYAEESARYYSALIASGVGKTEDRFTQLRVQAQIADALSFLGRGDEAIDVQRDILASARSFYDDEGTLLAEDALISALIETAEVFYTSTYDADIHEQGIAAADEAIDLLRARTMNDPATQDRLERLPLALYQKGRILAWLERYAEAAPIFYQAIESAEHHREVEPENLETIRRLTIFRQEYGFALSGLGKHAEAIAEIETALRTIRRLHEAEQGDRGYESQLARGYYNLAEAQLAAEDHSAACSAAQESERRFGALGDIEAYSLEYIVPEVKRIIGSTCEG
jgi:serine/threonine-protein kinase